MKLADLIRSMTDEEMAEFFATEIFNGPVCENCPATSYCYRDGDDYDDCKKAFMRWITNDPPYSVLYRVERRIQEEQRKVKE